MFADACIVVTLLVVIFYGFLNIMKEGTTKVDTVYAINPISWTDAIGFAAYSYEGMAVILPVGDITENK